MYARFSYTMVCIPEFFNFSHFCDFHIPFVYQNSYMQITYQNFWHIPVSYQAGKTTFFVFCHGKTFSCWCLRSYGHYYRINVWHLIAWGNVCLNNIAISQHDIMSLSAMPPPMRHNVSWCIITPQHCHLTSRHDISPHATPPPEAWCLKE